MSATKYLGMKQGDLENKPYAKYWNPKMQPMQEHVQQSLLHGAEAAELGFPIEEANQLLQPGYLELENGYTRLANGQIFAAILTKMPGVTGKMIDWWFGWHYLESQRYKLWHPRCHVKNGAKRMVSDDPNLTDKEKYLNNPNYVTEYISDGLQDITITFYEPSTFYDTSRFAEANVSTVICGTVSFQTIPLNLGVLSHMIRETEDGCEMRSRFWLGNFRIRELSFHNPLHKLIPSKWMAKLAGSLDLGKDMVVHCGMEMNHLASFLPELYNDYH
ncbi:MAG: hypothetical protein AAF518_18535 [Spirochaetota bacterium]